MADDRKRTDHIVSSIERYGRDPQAAMRAGMPTRALQAIGEAAEREKHRQDFHNGMRIEDAARRAVGAPDPYAMAGVPAEAAPRKRRKR